MKYRSDRPILKLSAALGFALCVLISSGQVRADLIKTDDLVVDTSTGLEWLNLTRTQQLSVNQVFAQLGPDGQFSGFQYATRDQFVTLFEEVFGTPKLTNSTGSLDLNATENFANLFGPTSFAVPITGEHLPEASGYFDATPGVPGGQGRFSGGATGIAIYYVNTDPGGSNGLVGASDTDFFSGNSLDPLYGSFLVRPVTEPPLSLLSAALIGLAAVMLRRRRKRASI
jgi:hypothetical protein